MNHQRSFYKSNSKSLLPIIEEIERTPEKSTVDMNNWENYKTEWHGFELKYPDNWNKPLLKSITNEAGLEHRYQFRKSENKENNLYSGFDVVIYNINNIKFFSNTIENRQEKLDVCQKIKNCQIKNENPWAKKIYAPFDNSYNTPFYPCTLIRGNYIYKIVPIIDGTKEKNKYLERELHENFPEFISISSTFNFIGIKRPKAKFRLLHKIPMPHLYNIDNLGRKICNRKNDHPQKSKKNKPRHMDMECCLDPDETPNPNCYYDRNKYGKYL